MDMGIRAVNNILIINTEIRIFILLPNITVNVSTLETEWEFANTIGKLPWQVLFQDTLLAGMILL